jgi:hypothetical protein
MSSTSSSPTSGRRVGYLIAIFFLIIFIVFINNLRNWNLPFVNDFVTPAYSDWLWAGNLSLSVAIFCNVLFLVYDPRWFHGLMEAIQNAFSLFSTLVFFNIFPLRLPSASIEQYVRWGLIIAMVLTGLALLINVIQAVVGLLRASTT